MKKGKDDIEVKFNETDRAIIHALEPALEGTRCIKIQHIQLH